MQGGVFLNNIECLRKARKMTRQELGDRLGVKPPAIYKWERGLGLPQMETAIRMADVFGVSLDYLMGRDSA